MQPAAAPCITGAFSFKTMKLSMSACCMHAATSLNLQEWVCPLDGWTPWTDGTSPLPTYAPWTQELNLSWETRFFVQKGTPWQCGFSLHSATTDTAHLCSHCICNGSLTALQPLTISAWLLQASLYWGLSWPAASHQPSAKMTRKVCRIWSLVFSQNDHP